MKNRLCWVHSACGMHSQNKSCGQSRCQSMQQCFTPEMRVWCAECGESSFGQTLGGCAASTIIHDVGTWWVHDTGWSWWRTGMVHTDESECMQMHATTCRGESTSWKCVGWLIGCWGVWWLCRWVLDVTMSLGKIHGSGGVGIGYDRCEAKCNVRCIGFCVSWCVWAVLCGSVFIVLLFLSLFLYWVNHQMCSEDVLSLQYRWIVQVMFWV